MVLRITKVLGKLQNLCCTTIRRRNQSLCFCNLSLKEGQRNVGLRLLYSHPRACIRVASNRERPIVACNVQLTRRDREVSGLGSVTIHANVQIIHNGLAAGIFERQIDLFVSSAQVGRPHSRRVTLRNGKVDTPIITGANFERTVCGERHANIRLNV